PGVTAPPRPATLEAPTPPDECVDADPERPDPARPDLRPPAAGWRVPDRRHAPARPHRLPRPSARAGIPVGPPPHSDEGASGTGRLRPEARNEPGRVAGGLRASDRRRLRHADPGE